MCSSDLQAEKRTRELKNRAVESKKQEGEEREKGIENVFEETTENFSNLKKETDIQIQETEGPKQDEPKQTYIKTYYNKNGKS